MKTEKKTKSEEEKDVVGGVSVPSLPSGVERADAAVPAAGLRVSLDEFVDLKIFLSELRGVVDNNAVVLDGFSQRLIVLEGVVESLLDGRVNAPLACSSVPPLPSGPARFPGL